MPPAPLSLTLLWAATTLAAVPNGALRRPILFEESLP